MFRFIFETKSMAFVNVLDEVEDVTTDPFMLSYSIGSRYIYIKVCDEIKDKTLHLILELYCTVRTNSLTRDLKHNEKSLRKDIKGHKI